jgi:urease gamma subunit
MLLTLRERERLMIYTAAKLAAERRARGLKLNLPEAIEEAIQLAEAGPDDALGGSGVLVTGSVITAGEARTLMSGRRS